VPTIYDDLCDFLMIKYMLEKLENKEVELKHYSTVSHMVMAKLSI
jgi:hypothetical protein